MKKSFNTNVLCFRGNRKNLIIFKFQKAITQSILGLGPWSMNQNDLEKNDQSISGDKNKGCHSKRVIYIAHAHAKIVKNLCILQYPLAIAANRISIDQLRLSGRDV